MDRLALRVLGPLELAVNGGLVELGGLRQRIVLSTLTLNVNRVTSVDLLIDAAWDTSPPSTARSQIQVCISALRRLFKGAEDLAGIDTRPPGYLLRVPKESLDSAQFARLVDEAQTQRGNDRADEAAATLRKALNLWRGPALADIPSELVRRQATVLDDNRFSALVDCIRLELELGRHQALIGELRVLIGEQPLREQLYALLMIALYRSGRQAEALEVSRQARQTLVEEAGIEPGPELQALELSILHQDPELGGPRPREEAIAPESGQVTGRTAPREVTDPAIRPRVTDSAIRPRQVPATIGDFTGREQQLAQIRLALTGQGDPYSVPYAVPIVAICGKGGIGKSTLAVRAAHELASVFPDGHLYAELGGPAYEGRVNEVLGRFLGALGVHGAAIPDDLRERVTLYRSVLAGRRLLLVLDDVGSEEQVQWLLPGNPGCAVILTSRARLSGLPGAQVLRLGAFEAERSLELLSKIIGPERVQAEPEDSAALTDLCGGLPLALRIAGARLASRPHWRVRYLVQRLSDEARRLDELTHRGLELRSNIDSTYHGLDQHSQRLFRLAAQLQAPDFPGWVAAALLDSDLAEAEEVLESLVDVQLVDAVTYPGARLHRYRLHDLVRIYARERSLEADSAATRAEALERVLGGWLTLATEGHRKLYGGDYVSLRGRAARWWPSGGALTEVMGNPMDWWEEERGSVRAAIQQAAEAGLDDACWDLALAAVSLFEVKGYFDDWREVLQFGLDATRRSGNRQGEAAMLYSLGELLAFQTRLAEADRCYAQAQELFEETGNSYGAALVLSNWALIDRRRGRTDAMVAKYERALPVLRASGDKVAEAHVLTGLAQHVADTGDIDRAKEMLSDALTMTRETGCQRVESQVLHRFADLCRLSGEIEQARESLNQALRIVRSAGDLIGEAHVLCALGIVRRAEGRLDTAVLTLEHAVKLARRLGERMIEGQACYALAEVALVSGDDGNARSHLETATSIFRELDAAVWHDKAQRLLSEFQDGGHPAPAPQQRGLPRSPLSVSGPSRRARVILANPIQFRFQSGPVSCQPAPSSSPSWSRPSPCLPIVSSAAVGAA